MNFLIDYGAGNIKSVLNALNYLNINVIITSDAKELKKASRIILPGVGAYKNCIDSLKKINLDQALMDLVIEKKIPYLGICVGFQILSEFGLEFGKTEGLGFLSGETLDMKNDTSKRLPHMGWNKIDFSQDYNLTKNNLFNNIDTGSFFYFLHSFHFKVKNQEFITSTFEYENKFVASIQKDNIYGVQFHPEKSQNNGLKILENFFKKI
jgi:glutamine amidotransferase